jgi:hypothetical protein
MKTPILVRLLMALVGALAAGTLCWIAFGLLTGGDHFGNGYRHVRLSAALAAIAGGLVAFRIRARALMVVLAVAGIGSGLFWKAVPDRWWAKRPPTRSM